MHAIRPFRRNAPDDSNGEDEDNDQHQRYLRQKVSIYCAAGLEGVF